MKTTKHRRATANQTKSKNLVRQTRSEALLRNRRGFLLLAVLLVVSAVTLASLAFMKSMLLGHEESRLTGQSIQARYAADSGIDAARLFVAYTKAQRLEAGGSFDNPNTFQAIPVLQGPAISMKTSSKVQAAFSSSEHLTIPLFIPSMLHRDLWSSLEHK